MSRQRHSLAKQMGDADFWKKLDLTIHGTRADPEFCRLVEQWAWLLELSTRTDPSIPQGCMLKEIKRRLPKALSKRFFGMKKKGLFSMDLDALVSEEFRKAIPLALAEELLGQAKKAIKSGDGSFFRKFAAVVESIHAAPVDPLRCELLDIMFKMEVNSISGVTLATVSKELKKRGIEVDPRHLRRVLGEVGFPVLPDRIGRPRKSDN